MVVVGLGSKLYTLESQCIFCAPAFVVVVWRMCCGAGALLLAGDKGENGGVPTSTATYTPRPSARVGLNMQPRHQTMSFLSFEKSTSVTFLENPWLRIINSSSLVLGKRSAQSQRKLSKK